MEFQRISRTTAMTGNACASGFPRISITAACQTITAGPLLLGTPALAGEDGDAGETARPFPLSAVGLLDGPIQRARRRNAHYLEPTNSDRFLDVNLPMLMRRAPLQNAASSQRSCRGP